jgi:hypothetical protein
MCQRVRRVHVAFACAVVLLSLCVERTTFRAAGEASKQHEGLRRHRRGGAPRMEFLTKNKTARRTAAVPESPCTRVWRVALTLRHTTETDREPCERVACVDVRIDIGTAAQKSRLHAVPVPVIDQPGHTCAGRPRTAAVRVSSSTICVLSSFGDASRCRERSCRAAHARRSTARRLAGQCCFSTRTHVGLCANVCAKPHELGGRGGAAVASSALQRA